LNALGRLLVGHRGIPGGGLEPFAVRTRLSQGPLWSVLVIDDDEDVRHVFEETAALTQELHEIVENDRYPFSPRIRTLRVYGARRLI
jgi:hypothetical protein